MKIFGTREHSLCLFEDAFPAENLRSTNFGGRGSDRLFPFEKATISSVQSSEKGAIFSDDLTRKV
jgi:hypothetical protein